MGSTVEHMERYMVSIRVPPLLRSGAVGVPPTAVGRRRERFPHLRMGHSCMLQLNSNTQYTPLSVAIEMAQAGTCACFAVAATAAAAARRPRRRYTIQNNSNRIE